MKNRKFVVAAFLLVAAMLLGVGYAALTDELAINGNLGADISIAEAEFDGDVYFGQAVIMQDDTGHKANVTYENENDTANITCTAFTTEGNTVKVLLPIYNEHVEFDAKVTPDVTNITIDNGDADHDPVFSATWEWSNASGDALGLHGAKTISKKTGDTSGVEYVLVTITLNETPTETHSATFTVNFDVVSVE